MVAQFKGSATFHSFIIPPTRFGDLGGMLVGVQSGYLDDPAGLDGLCVKLGGDLSDPKWVAARGAFLQSNRADHSSARGRAPVEEADCPRFSVGPDERSMIAFKSKVRVLLKNNTERSNRRQPPHLDSGFCWCSLADTRQTRTMRSCNLRGVWDGTKTTGGRKPRQ